MTSHLKGHNLNMDAYGAETLSSYPGLDTHTHTHTQIQTGERTVGDTLPRGRHWNSLLFPERHFNVSRSQTGSLCWRVVMFHNKAIYIYWIQRLRCCEMYLPVHFVYKKPGMGIGILYKEKYITMYIAIILNAL